MAKAKSVYTCTECGGNTSKWQGQCPSCGVWNTLVETVAEGPTRNRFSSLAKTSSRLKLSEVSAKNAPRIDTGIPEFDRVLGGGLVAGQVVLIGGDPGVGKSTLLLQALAQLGQKGPRRVRLLFPQPVRVLSLGGAEIGSGTEIEADLDVYAGLFVEVRR